MQTQAFVVGLTGGIASGKSTVAQLFVAAGAEHIDCDLLARKVVAPGRAELQQIAEHFGADMLLADGNLNRAKMRELVFQQAEQRQALEAILHPAIRAEIQAAIQANSSAPYKLLDAPLLIEMKLSSTVQRVCVIDVEPEQQIERLIARDGIDIPLAKQMLAAQISRNERLSAADDIIDNRGSLAELKPQVQRLHQAYCQLATG